MARPRKAKSSTGAKFYGLKASRADAHFMADGKAQHLENEGDVFVTADSGSYAALAGIPWLEALGRVNADGEPLGDAELELDSETDETPDGAGAGAGGEGGEG